jgi:crotonobetainyl-CoA:carnitine CoA-transferase CaiB-like acyl-CoA transferase
VRANLSLGDSLAGLEAALGILLALRARDADPRHRGQVVDVAIFEAVFGVLESVLPEFDRLGRVRGPSGATLTGIVPSNAYPCADGRSVIVGANNTANFRRLMTTAGRRDLAADPALATNPGRVPRQAEIDAAIAAWTRTLPAAEVVARLEAASVPASTSYTVADMVADPHYQARGLIESVDVGGRPLRVPATGPRLSATPARTEFAGRELGADTRAVLAEKLELSDGEIDLLVGLGAIALA